MLCVYLFTVHLHPTKNHYSHSLNNIFTFVVKNTAECYDNHILLTMLCIFFTEFGLKTRILTLHPTVEFILQNYKHILGNKHLVSCIFSQDHDEWHPRGINKCTVNRNMVVNKVVDSSFTRVSNIRPPHDRYYDSVKLSSRAERSTQWWRCPVS